MFCLSYEQWMDFWRTASAEAKKERMANLRQCMHGRAENGKYACEEQMSLCEWFEEPAGFRFATCRVPDECGEFREY